MRLVQLYRPKKNQSNLKILIGNNQNPNSLTATTHMYIFFQKHQTKLPGKSTEQLRNHETKKLKENKNEKIRVSRQFLENRMKNREFDL